MLSKDDVRHAVSALLRLEVEDRLQRKLPDVYYGWVSPTADPETGKEVPGYWMGDADIKQAEYRLAMAQVRCRAVNHTTWSDDEADEMRRAQAQADAAVAEAARNLEEVRAFTERAIEARREQLINRRVAKLFLKTYRKAVTMEWDLYNAAVPDSLRRYIQRQLARTPLAPTSVVFLWLVLESTIAHSDDFQTEAITAYNHLASNPLAVAALDIDVPEDEPSAVHRAYVRELQVEAIRDRRKPAHENLDRRDILADFEYHGMPEQLGAMWIEKGESCPHCKQGLRVRMVNDGPGYRYAKVCPNYAEDAQCSYDPLSPMRATRRELRDWALVEWATEQAA